MNGKPILFIICKESMIAVVLDIRYSCMSDDMVNTPVCYLCVINMSVY